MEQQRCFSDFIHLSMTGMTSLLNWVIIFEHWKNSTSIHKVIATELTHIYVYLHIIIFSIPFVSLDNQQNKP